MHYKPNRIFHKTNQEIRSRLITTLPLSNERVFLLTRFEVLMKGRATAASSFNINRFVLFLKFASFICTYPLEAGIAMAKNG